MHHFNMQVISMAEFVVNAKIYISLIQYSFKVHCKGITLVETVESIIEKLANEIDIK